MDLIVGAGITGLSYAAATSNDYLGTVVKRIKLYNELIANVI